jgi:AcrR family transcriptional regulator
VTTFAEQVAVQAAEQAAGPAARRGQRTRADALRNRERIVGAAREVLVEFGTEVPFDEIARRAGIGNATLYRHFPDRRALLHEVVLSVVTRSADHAEAAVGDPDPYAGLRRFAHAAVDENIGAMCSLLLAEGDGEQDFPALAAQYRRLVAAVETVMDRARRTGQLRDDVTFDDLMVAVAQLSRPLPGITCMGFDAHRHLRLFLDGLRTAAATTQAPRAATTTS